MRVVTKCHNNIEKYCSLFVFQVCTHITRCYAVAAQFEECREKITEMPGIIKDLCRVLYHRVCYNNEKHLTSRFLVAVRVLSNRSH